MKHLNTKEISPDAHAGSPQENTRVPASRYSGKRSRAGRATIPYIIARLFSRAQANLFALAAILAFAASCVAKIDEGAPVVGDGERLVTLSLTTPSASPTRGLTTLEEDAVHTVDVLLFKGENFFYRAIGSALDASKNFTVKLPSNAAPYKAVVLANARAMLSTLPIPVAQEQASGTSRTSVLASITQQLSGSVPGWTSALATAGIPMWGYENDLAVNESSYNPAATISLTRMLSKIDITVAADVTNFKLASARLYNYSEKGSIAPAASTSSASGYDITQWNGAKAIAPHLPTDAKVGAGLYIDYPIDTHPGSVSFTNEIYAYEAQAGAANTVTNTCLVISGYYEGSTSPTYYRVEFVGTDGITFLHLLRNHKYAVEIKEVTAHGYSSANDAYINKPANIVVQITPWNEGGLNDITFGPQHYLAVDKSEIIFYAGGGNKSMEAITDFPAGWTIEKDAIHDWFTVSPLAHASTSQQTITVTIPTGNGPREGFFYVVAGNLRKKIIVKQLAADEFSLSITDPVTGNPLNELSFDVGDIGDGTLPVARSFRVTWLPADADCEVTLTPVAGMDPFPFNTSGSGVNPLTISPLTGGSATITIQPDPLAAGDPDRVSRLDLSVANNGQYRTGVLYLRQVKNYVTLSQTTYSTNVAVPPPANISMTTNIPLGELTATVTGTGGLVSGATIQAGPVLRVNFRTNTLTGATSRTYTVQVKHGAQVMATLTVNVSGSGWEVIGGKLVQSTMRFVTIDKFLTDETNCPAGSSSPRSSDDAMWYELWLGGMYFSTGSIFDGAGLHYPAHGVIWYGTALQHSIKVETGEPAIYYTLPCVWNQTILSEDVGHIDLNKDPLNTTVSSGTYRYAYGQYARVSNAYVGVQIRCVVW